MKKFLLLVAAVMAVALLSAPMAYAAPSPTESGPSPVDIDGPDVPLGEMTMEIDEETMEIDEPEVPLADIPSPQTGVTGLSGMEVLTMAAVAFALSGAVILVKAREQTDSVR